MPTPTYRIMVCHFWLKRSHSRRAIEHATGAENCFARNLLVKFGPVAMSDQSISARPIFLVEDNPDDARLTIRALRRGHVTNPVQVARDGEEALSLLFAAEQLPMVVLLDLKLPKVDGLEVLHQLRENERTRRLPVVILTSSNEQRDIIESYNLGANSYVRKPVDFNQFTNVVSQLGLYWVLINEPLPEER